MERGGWGEKEAEGRPLGLEDLQGCPWLAFTETEVAHRDARVRHVYLVTWFQNSGSLPGYKP